MNTPAVPNIASIQDMVVRSAQVFGEKHALEDLKDTPLPKVTYAGLLKNVLRFGAALRRLGIPDRSHIAVIGENRVQWGVAYFTGMCFNHVVVPIDKNLSINEILNILHESDAVAVVYSDAFEPLLGERRSSMKRLRWYINMDLPSRHGDSYSMLELINAEPPGHAEELPAIDPHEVAAIVYTSGSLGRAKGVMLSQANLASNLMSMVSSVQLVPEDRFLSVLPIHHTYECTCGLLCPLYCGSSVYYARSLKTVVDDLQVAKATILLGVPLLYEKMFKRISKAIQEKALTSVAIRPLIALTDILERVGWTQSKKTVFKEIHQRFGGCIRLFIAGGAAPDPLVAKGLRAFGFGFIQGYGLTETSPILALNLVENFKDNAAGLPLRDVTLRIDKADHEGVGEIWAKGPNIMLGYYKNEQATRDTFEDGWFKTGDLGYIDGDGFLHISGRKKNVIISKTGENVYPEEIEDILNRSPYVMECMVFGERDPKMGEIIAVQIVADAEAFIEMSETRHVEITPALMDEIIAKEVARVNKDFPVFKQIRKFYRRDQEFEKTTTQKVKRYLVQTT